MSYQLVIRDSSNSLVLNSTVGVRISILQTSINGNVVYIETHTTSTNDNGLASIEIGGGTIVNGNYTNINWALGPYFLKSETDPLGGNNYSNSVTTQLMSVPYAFYATKSKSADVGGDFKHYIGEYYGGGVIFHLWKDSLGVEHGLIVDKYVMTSPMVWSDIINTPIGSTAQSNFDGLSNSIAIVSQPGHTISAANYCLDNCSSGYCDWYLPAIQELNMLNKNCYTVSRALSQIPGANPIRHENHWSSTEASNLSGLSYVMYEYFLPIYSTFKADQCYLRAVRAF